MLPVLEESSSRPLTTVAQAFLYCRDRLADLDKVAQKDISLNEEREAVADLLVSLHLSIGHRQSILVAIFLARRLSAADSAEFVKKCQGGIKRHQPGGWETRAPPTTCATSYKEHTAQGCRPFATCQPWRSRSGSRSPRSARLPTNAGTQILYRDSGQSSGNCTPPARGQSRGVGRVNRGGRDTRSVAGVKLYALQQTSLPTTATPLAQQIYITALASRDTYNMFCST